MLLFLQKSCQDQASNQSVEKPYKIAFIQKIFMKNYLSPVSNCIGCCKLEEGWHHSELYRSILGKMSKLRGYTIDWGGLEDMFLFILKGIQFAYLQVIENCFRVTLQYAQGETTRKDIPKLVVWRKKLKLACSFLFPNCGAGNKLKPFEKKQLYN